jgi:cob(I)alamin adenosyltransferase
MVKAERRIRAFLSGIKKLDNNSLNYIHRLTQVLFLVECPPVYPVSGGKTAELEKKNRPYEMR